MPCSAYLMHWSACTHCAARHKILMPWGTGVCLGEHWYAVANMYMHWDSEHMPCETLYMPCRIYALQIICRVRHGALRICIAGHLSAWHLHKYQCVSTRRIFKADHIPVDTKMIEHTPCANWDMPCRTYALQIIRRARHGALKICIEGRVSARHLHKYQCVSTRRTFKAFTINLCLRFIYISCNRLWRLIVKSRMTLISFLVSECIRKRWHGVSLKTICKDQFIVPHVITRVCT